MCASLPKLKVICGVWYLGHFTWHQSPGWATMAGWPVACDQVDSPVSHCLRKVEHPGRGMDVGQHTTVSAKDPPSRWAARGRAARVGPKATGDSCLGSAGSGGRNALALAPWRAVNNTNTQSAQSKVAPHLKRLHTLKTEKENWFQLRSGDHAVHLASIMFSLFSQQP